MPDGRPANGGTVDALYVANRSPVPGARGHLGADGRAAFDVEAVEGERVALVYRKDGAILAGPAVSRLAPAGPAWVWEVTLDTYTVRRMEFRVLDPLGVAVPGARVGVPDMFVSATAADSDGRCSLLLPIGVHVLVSARTPDGRYGDARAIVGGRSREPVLIVLDRHLVSVKFRLDSSAWPAMRGRALSVQVLDQPGFHLAAGGGEHTLEIVAPARGFVTVSDPGRDDASNLVVLPLRVDSTDRAHVVRLRPSADLLAIVVLKVDASAFAPARLEIAPETRRRFPGLHVRVGWSEIEHAALGSPLAFESAPRGRHRVFVRRSRYAAWERTPRDLVVTAGGGTLRIDLLE